jgi:hypothetical protein
MAARAGWPAMDPRSADRIGARNSGSMAAKL